MHGSSPSGQTRPTKTQVINLSEESQTVNVKELTKEITNLKKMIESLVQQPQAKDHVEESAGASQAADVAGIVRKQFKEFLKNDEKKTFSLDDVRQAKEYKEAIGAVTSGSAIPSTWSSEPELLSPDGADGYFLKTPVVQWKTDVKEKPGQITYVQTIGAVANKRRVTIRRQVKQRRLEQPCY